MSPDGSREPVRHLPGDVLVHPAIVVSLGLLLLNDLYLKSAQPGPISWKLSDFTGLAFFPALAFAMTEIVMSGVRRSPVLLAPRWSWLYAALTASFFALLKLSPAAGEAAERANDALLGVFSLSRGPTVFTPDTSDLLAVPAVLVTVWVVYQWRG
jgi:hypothetical protein